MKVCPKDKNTHLDSDNFCFICGSKLIEESSPKCPKCKEEVFRRASFCSNCGYKLKKT